MMKREVRFTLEIFLIFFYAFYQKTIFNLTAFNRRSVNVSMRGGYQFVGRNIL